MGICSPGWYSEVTYQFDSANLNAMHRSVRGRASCLNVTRENRRIYWDTHTDFFNYPVTSLKFVSHLPIFY